MREVVGKKLSAPARASQFHIGSERGELGGARVRGSRKKDKKMIGLGKAGDCNKGRVNSKGEKKKVLTTAKWVVFEKVQKKKQGEKKSQNPHFHKWGATGKNSEKKISEIREGFAS